MATYFNSFNEYTSGLAPDDFSWKSLIGTGHTVEDAVTGSNGKVLQSISTVNSSGRILCWDDVVDEEDGELFVRFKFTSTVGALSLHSRLINNDVDGYLVKINIGTSNNIIQYSLSNNSLGSLASTGSFTISANTWYKARFGVVGSTIRTKVWADADEEPVSWFLQKTNTAFSGAGKLGVYGYTNNATLPVYIDTFSVGTGVDSAPLVDTSYTLTVNATTEDSDAFCSLEFLPSNFLYVSATTEDSIASVLIRNTPDILLTVSPTTENSVLSANLLFYPVINITVNATTEDSVFSANFINDWGDIISSRPDYFSIYRAYVINDGEFVEIPMKSFQASINYGRNSFVSIIIPDVDDVSLIVAAASGQFMKIKKGFRNSLTGSEQLEDFISIPMTTIRPAEGGNNSTITIEGLALLNFGIPKTREIKNVTYKSLNSYGGYILRAPIDLLIRPGDIASYGAINFTVGSITMYATPTEDTMEVSQYNG